MNKKGFTLVELLVVIAIIGILSSVAVINLNSARNKAKSAAVQATVAQLTTPAIVCLDSGQNLNTIASNSGLETADLCNSATAVTVNWPKINQHGYDYENQSIVSTPSALTWNFNLNNSAAGLTNIKCSQAGCVIQ